MRIVFFAIFREKLYLRKVIFKNIRKTSYLAMRSKYYRKYYSFFMPRKEKNKQNYFLIYIGSRPWTLLGNEKVWPAFVGS